jgi:hypothetical protein
MLNECLDFIFFVRCSSFLIGSCRLWDFKLAVEVAKIGGRGDGGCVCQSQHPDEQGVATAENHHQDLLDHRILADYHLSNFFLHLSVDRVQFFGS